MACSKGKSGRQTSASQIGFQSFLAGKLQAICHGGDGFSFNAISESLELIGARIRRLRVFEGCAGGRA